MTRRAFLWLWALAETAMLAVVGVVSIVPPIEGAGALALTAFAGLLLGAGNVALVAVALRIPNR